jgi:hypothetical protein
MYTNYAISVHLKPALTGAHQCHSNNRTMALHWHFGNEHNVGWVAIGLSIVFGGLALYVVWHLRTQKPEEKIKEFDALKVVDAFKLGVKTADVEVKGEEDRTLLCVRNGSVFRLS